jgi:hypothetical protein
LLFVVCFCCLFLLLLFVCCCLLLLFVCLFVVVVVCCLFLLLLFVCCLFVVVVVCLLLLFVCCCCLFVVFVVVCCLLNQIPDTIYVCVYYLFVKKMIKPDNICYNLRDVSVLDLQMNKTKKIFNFTINQSQALLSRCFKFFKKYFHVLYLFTVVNKIELIVNYIHDSFLRFCCIPYLLCDKSILKESNNDQISDIISIYGKYILNKNLWFFCFYYIYIYHFESKELCTYNSKVFLLFKKYVKIKYV